MLRRAPTSTLAHTAVSKDTVCSCFANSPTPNRSTLRSNCIISTFRKPFTLCPSSSVSSTTNRAISLILNGNPSIISSAVFMTLSFGIWGKYSEYWVKIFLSIFLEMVLYSLHYNGLSKQPIIGRGVSLHTRLKRSFGLPRSCILPTPGVFGKMYTDIVLKEMSFHNNINLAS